MAAPTVELRPSRQAGTQRLAHPLRRPDIADSAEAAERQLPSAPRRTSIRHCDESSSREQRRRVSDHRSGLAADGPSDGLSPSPLRTASRNALGAICAQTRSAYRLDRTAGGCAGRIVRYAQLNGLSPRTARSYVLPISHIMSSQPLHIASDESWPGRLPTFTPPSFSSVSQDFPPPPQRCGTSVG